MRTIASKLAWNHFARLAAGAVVYGLMVAWAAAEPTVSLALEGYTEPYRTINVAADEMGIIEEVLVQEGEAVEAGHPLARLNSDVHLGLLAIAEQSMQSKGRLDAARAELDLRQERLAKLRSLRIDGHARQEEVDRAEAEVEVGEANLRTAQEELLTRKLEYEKIKTQIDRRTVRAPISGVVTTLHRQQGEFVAPNSPDVLTLVQIDTLLANFTVMSPEAAKLRKGQKIKLRIVNGAETQGVVEFIAPVTDAESGTVRVKVRIANPDGRVRSGERCTMSATD